MGYTARSISATDVSGAVLSNTSYKLSRAPFIFNIESTINTGTLTAGSTYQIFEGDILMDGFTTTIISGFFRSGAPNHVDGILRIKIDGSDYANLTCVNDNWIWRTDTDTTLSTTGAKTVSLEIYNDDAADAPNGFDVKECWFIIY